MKTYTSKPSQISRAWYLIDAKDATLGRVATAAARLLIGKGKPTFTPHMDDGDYVVIINSDAVLVTGGKEQKKVYYRHSGYPGGIYQRTLTEQLSKDSTKVVSNAIRGMLPVNKLRKGRLARLKIYSGEHHNHEAQKPRQISLKEDK